MHVDYALSLTSVGIVTTVVAGICTDIWGRRWLTAFPAAIILIISSSTLLAWDSISIATKWAMFSLGGFGYVQQGPFFSWANDAGRSDVERAATLFGMNMCVFTPVDNLMQQVVECGQLVVDPHLLACRNGASLYTRPHLDDSDRGRHDDYRERPTLRRASPATAPSRKGCRGCARGTRQSAA